MEYFSADSINEVRPPNGRIIQSANPAQAGSPWMPPQHPECLLYPPCPAPRTVLYATLPGVAAIPMKDRSRAGAVHCFALPFR